MNEHFSVFRKEWSLYMKKELFQFMCFFLCGGAAGFLLLYLVLTLGGEDTTYIYLMSVMAMVFAGIGTIIIGSSVSSHFLLGVFMGQKRKNLIISALVLFGMLTLAGYTAVNLLLLFEENVYPVLFSGRQAEGEWLVLCMRQWGFPVIAMVMLLIWFFFVLSMKFGNKVFWIPYIVWMTIMVFGVRLSHNGFGRILDRILAWISGFTPAVWLGLCVAAVVFIIGIGSRILMRIDVK